MGIVVSVCMLLGLVLFWPWPSAGVDRLRHKPALMRAGALVVLLAGAWNALWHGLRHLDAFWGLAALVSGIFMMAAAAGIRAAPVPGSPVTPTASWGRGLVPRLVFAGLLACFLLYAVTLVRLNLGYSIIGN